MHLSLVSHSCRYYRPKYALQPFDVSALAVILTGASRGNKAEEQYMCVDTQHTGFLEPNMYSYPPPDPQDDDLAAGSRIQLNYGGYFLVAAPNYKYPNDASSTSNTIRYSSRARGTSVVPVIQFEIIIKPASFRSWMKLLPLFVTSFATSIQWIKGYNDVQDATVFTSILLLTGAISTHAGLHNLKLNTFVISIFDRAAFVNYIVITTYVLGIIITFRLNSLGSQWAYIVYDHFRAFGLLSVLFYCAALAHETDEFGRQWLRDEWWWIMLAIVLSLFFGFALLREKFIRRRGVRALRAATEAKVNKAQTLASTTPLDEWSVETVGMWMRYSREMLALQEFLGEQGLIEISTKFIKAKIDGSGVVELSTVSIDVLTGSIGLVRGEARIMARVLPKLVAKNMKACSASETAHAPASEPTKVAVEQALEALDTEERVEASLEPHTSKRWQGMRNVVKVITSGLPGPKTQTAQDSATSATDMTKSQL